MTIKDLARLSGYSLGTVSRVLNNQPNVSDKARAAILAIAEESGFELNESAQLLKQQRSNAVLIIVKGHGERDVCEHGRAAAVPVFPHDASADRRFHR